MANERFTFFNSKNSKSLQDHAYQNFLYKALLIPSAAIVTERVGLHPIDTITTFQQQRVGHLIQTLKFIFQNYGVFGFYKGLSFALVLASIPSQLSIYGTYYGTKELLHQKNSLNERSVELVSSLAAGVFSPIYLTPVEAKRIRDTLGISVTDPFSPRVFFRGFLPTAIKCLIYTPTVLVGTDRIKEKFPHNPYIPFLSGLVTSAISTIFTTPADMVKTRLMSDYSANTTFISEAKYVWNNKLYFHSLTARMARISLGSCLVMGTIDFLNHKLLGVQQPKSNPLRP